MEQFSIALRDLTRNIRIEVQKRYMWMTFLFFVSTTWNEFMVSSLHIQKNLWFWFSISDGIAVFTTLWLIGDFVTTGASRTFTRISASLWKNKGKVIVYLVITALLSSVISFLQLWNNTVDTVVGNLLSIGISLILYGSIFVIASWILRRQLKGTENQVERMASPKKLIASLSPFLVGLVAYGILALTGRIMAWIGVSNGTGIVVIWWVGAFVMGWFLNHLSNRIHYFSGTHTAEINYSAKDTRNGIIAIATLSFIGVFVGYFTNPGYELFKLNNGYWIDNAIEETSANAGTLQRAFIMAKTMQANSLSEYAYLLYEKKDFAGAKTAIDNALQTNPTLAVDYEIQSYIALQTGDSQIATNDVSTLENLNHPRMANWIQYKIDENLGNAAQVQSDWKKVVEAGLPIGLLQYTLRTVLTSTEGTEKVIETEIHNADLELIDLPIVASQQKNTGEDITLVQQLESAWPSNEAYVIPNDAAEADMMFTSLYGRIGDIHESTQFANRVLSIKGASSQMTQNAQELILAFGSLPQSQNNENNTPVNGTDPNSIFDNGISAYINNQISTARNDFLQIVQNDPQSSVYSGALAGLAICDYKLGDTADSIRCANVATQSSQAYTKAVGYTVLGNIEDDQGNNLAKTIQYYQEAVKYNPSEYLAWYYMGVAYQSENKNYQAIDAFSQSIKEFTKDNDRHL